MKINSIYSLVGLLLAGQTLVATDAVAATSQRIPASNATGFCQPALPAFDGNIRKRPLSVQNEGTATAFVTCTLPVEARAIGGKTTRAFAYFHNSNDAATTVTCTLVQGVLGFSEGPNIIKSITMPANTNLQILLWDAAANGGNLLGEILSLSCSLPPNTGVDYLAVDFMVDVGM